MITYLITAAAAFVAGVVGLGLFWMWQGARGPATRPTADHGPDRLSHWEEIALLATGAASAFNVLLWALGYTLADAAPGWTALGVLRVAFSVLSFVSMDLVVVVTVMAMRAGRRGLWSEVCSLVAALAAAGIALEVSGVVAWPWLHAAPMVVLYTFMRHLAAPKVVQRAAVLARERDALAQEAHELRAERDALAREAGRVPGLLGQRDAEAAQAREDLAQALADADHWRAMAAQAAARPALTADHDTITVGTKQVSLRALAQELEVPKTSLGRAVDRVAQKGG